MADVARPIGVLYEHPAWFTPLFAELDRRGLPYERVRAHEHVFDPAASSAPYSLVFNRVSPSAYLRGHTRAIFHAHHYLAHLEALGVPVVNGSRAYAVETSKARQLTLLASLGLPHPRSRAANHPAALLTAADGLDFPLIVKPNLGGSGALMRRFDSRRALRAAAEAGELEPIFGLDGTAIVQEYHPPRDGAIVRVEALAGQLLYAIRIANDPSQGFNLCPADICQVPGPEPAPPPGSQPSARAGLAGSLGLQLTSSTDEAPGAADDFAFCPVEAPASPARAVDATDPPAWVVDAVLRVFRAAAIDVGGVEYLESTRDGQLYFYDVNALSNFVADAPRVVSCDPFVPLVDYLARRAGFAQTRAMVA